MGLGNIILAAAFILSPEARLQCRPSAVFHPASLTSSQMGQTAIEALHDLLQDGAIRVGFHSGLAPLWSAINFSHESKQLALVTGEHLLFGISLSNKARVLGYRHLKEDCRGALFQERLLETERSFVESIRIVELEGMTGQALVPGVLAPQAMLTIPLVTGEMDDRRLSESVIMYIENGGRFQQELLRRLFGEMPLFFSQEEQAFDDSTFPFVVYLEEIYHLLDSQRRHPEFGSEIFADIDRVDRLEQRPPQRQLELEFRLYRNSQSYQALEAAELEAYKKEFPYPNLYRELIPIWKKKIELRVQRGYWQQMDLLFSYLYISHERLAKWNVMQTLRVLGLGEEASVSLMARATIESSLVFDRVKRYFQDLYRLEVPPESRSQAIMKALHPYSWPEPFRQIVARLTLSRAGFVELEPFFREIHSRQLWNRSIDDQAYEIYRLLEELAPSRGIMPIKKHPLFEIPQLNRVGKYF